MKKIQIPDAKESPLLPPDKIICIKAARKYSTVYYLPDEETNPPWKEVQCSYNLKCFETKLGKMGFARANRSAVINSAFLTAICAGDILLLKYNCCGSIKLSRVYKDSFMKKCVIKIGD